MDDERLPKRLFYSELTVGTWSIGGQRKRYKDTLKASLKDFNINPESWKGHAAERCAWIGPYQSFSDWSPTVIRPMSDGMVTIQWIDEQYCPFKGKVQH